MQLAVAPPRTAELDGLTAEPGSLSLHGKLDTAQAARLWPDVMRAVQARGGSALVLDVSDATDISTAGAALIAAVMARHGRVTLRGATPATAGLVASLPAGAPLRKAPVPWTFRGVGRDLGVRMADATAFLGESVVAAALIGRRWRQARLGDFARIADEAGVRAIPLVLLLGYLMGLILAFQSSIPLRRFGADLFIVNLVSLSLLRELGPLLASVVLAGRTGSAFAAELGTMKVNEELAALDTMGISVMVMLVLPRLLAAVLVMPVLTLLLELAGLCGMLTVMLAFGFPPAAVLAQLLRAVHAHDLWGGLFKAVCFGAIVAAIGCRARLATGFGARAVGRAATSAVVGGIVATVVLDGLFSILFYKAGV